MMKKNMSDEELKEKENQVRERLSGVDFDKVICPITFIGDHITNSDTVNSMYTHPYASHVAIQQIQKLYTPNINPTLMPTLNRYQNDSLYDSVLAYFHMNLYALTYDTLIKFIQEAFMFEIDNKLLPDGVNQPAAIYIVQKYAKLIDMDLQRELEMLPNYNMMVYNRYDGPDLSSMHEVVSARMSSIFSEVVEGIFNKAINKIVDHSLKDGSFETIFDIVYYACYEEAPSMEAKANVQVMVQFISGYLRQCMEDQLEMYRNGLDLMSMTIAGMLTEGRDYHETKTIETFEG